MIFGKKKKKIREIICKIIMPFQCLLQIVDLILQKNYVETCTKITASIPEHVKIIQDEIYTYMLWNTMVMVVILANTF